MNMKVQILQLNIGTMSCGCESIHLSFHLIYTPTIYSQYICPICSHLHNAEPGLLRGRPFGMEWSPTGSPVTEYSPRNSFSNLKQHYSAALGLGALLSSPT